MPFVLVSHAGYPAVTHGNTPATLSRKWITDILRKRLGYTGMVVSDDLEMGAILKTVSIEQATVQHIRAGGDLCLICHTEESIVSAYEAVLKEAERDRRFALQVANAGRRVGRLKNKSLKSIAWKFPPAPSASKLDRLSRQLWDFTERVRLRNFAREQEQA